MEKVFEIYIRTTPERLWEAITDPEIRSKYNFGATVDSDWTPGARFEFGHPARRSSSARARSSRRTRRARLVHTMTALWSDEVKSEGASRVTWEIEPVGDSCRLIAHPRPAPRRRQRPDLRRLADDPLRSEDVAGDGQLLTTPGSLMYAAGDFARNGARTMAELTRRPDLRYPHSRRAGPRPGPGTRVLHEVLGFQKSWMSASGTAVAGSRSGPPARARARAGAGQGQRSSRSGNGHPARLPPTRTNCTPSCSSAT